MGLNPLIIENTVRAALLEDLGHGHDITTRSVISGAKECSAVFCAREEGVLAGLLPALMAFTLTDPSLKIEVLAKDSDTVKIGQNIAIIKGSAAAILTAERTALNLLIHMSGIATLTQSYVRTIQGTNAKICDTRKTLANLRAFQKYAVRMGGGHNHRFGLDDAILIKDNHIAIAGGVVQALNNAKKYAGHTVKIEIEVDTLEQLEEVLKIGTADIVMLDNFTPQDLVQAIKMVDGKITTEASGNVNLMIVHDIAQSGVDYISVGALTHSAPALDIGLDIECSAK